jgi:hypothetical protein
LSYGARDIRIIRNILEGKLYELTDTVTPAAVFEQTSNSRDLWYYEQAVRGSTDDTPVGLRTTIPATTQTSAAGIRQQEGLL